jgi:hypothetical protein
MKDEREPQNLVKSIKRMMYGRPEFPLLLRQRVLDAL